MLNVEWPTKDYPAKKQEMMVHPNEQDKHPETIEILNLQDRDF